MLDLLRHVLGWVCGQNPAHTWMPGGTLLPVCQRCTGLYLGALIAALLHLAWRPVPTLRWRWLNGAFLLWMVPNGFYWIPQTPELRSSSGVLFGFGVVAFLWLTQPMALSAHHQVGPLVPGHGDAEAGKANPRATLSAFAAGLLAALVLVPLLAENGNAAAAAILSLGTLGGAGVLAALLLVNVGRWLRWLARRSPAAAA